MTDTTELTTAPAKPPAKLGVTAPVENIGGGMMVRPETARDLMDMAQMMAKSGPMVGKAFRNNPGACLAIMQKAYRVGLDPWALSSKTYLVNDSIAYEAQAVLSMVYASPAVIGRLQFDFDGEGQGRRVRVTGRVQGNHAPCEYVSPPLSQLSAGGRSPLWKTDPDQQMSYYGARAWARRHVPDVLMGVYTVDELQDANMVDVSAGRVDDAKARLTANLETFERDVVNVEAEPEPVDPPEPIDALTDPDEAFAAVASANPADMFGDDFEPIDDGDAAPTTGDTPERTAA